MQLKTFFYALSLTQRNTKLVISKCSIIIMTSRPLKGTVVW